MAQYTSKSALVAEIERRRDAALTRQKNLESIGQETVLNEMVANELNRILSFIDSLQEELVSEELENNAIQYAGKHAPYDDAMDEVEEAFKAGAKWQEKQDQSTIELAEDHAMLAGMKNMTEQMMAKAVEAKVTARWPLHSSPLYYSYEIYVPYAQHLSEGDKVKILIIKQEDD